MADTRWLELFERGGDEHVGAMLVRLAQKAAEVQRGQIQWHDVPNRPFVHTARTDAAFDVVRTEVDP